MAKLTKIKNKIAKVEKLLQEIKTEIELYEANEKKTKNEKKKVEKIEEIPSSEELIEEYNNLYQSFLSKNSEIVVDFVKAKSIKYLKKFCNVNNVSIDAGRQSKEKISNEIVRWFQQRKAISKRNQ